MVNSYKPQNYRDSEYYNELDGLAASGKYTSYFDFKNISGITLLNLTRPYMGNNHRVLCVDNIRGMSTDEFIICIDDRVDCIVNCEYKYNSFRNGYLMYRTYCGTAGEERELIRGLLHSHDYQEVLIGYQFIYTKLLAYESTEISRVRSNRNIS